MKMTPGFQKLQEVQEKLTAAGVQDVKFTWNPNVKFMDPDHVAGQVAKFLEMYLNGEYEVIFDSREHEISKCNVCNDALYCPKHSPRKKDAI